MTYEEAVRIATEFIEGDHGLTTDPEHCAACKEVHEAREAAAVLERTAPFVAAALEAERISEEYRGTGAHGLGEVRSSMEARRAAFRALAPAPKDQP